MRDLIRQERQSHAETFVGTVRSIQSRLQFDGTSSVIVADVDVGGNRIFKNVPIKANARGTRFYAQVGASVVLRRNAQGRWDVVGPGDRTIAAPTKKTYTIGNTTPSTTETLGFSTVFPPFEFYQGAVHMSGNPNVSFTTNVIIRVAGSFIDDGFLNGQVIRIGNSLFNDGTVTLTAPPTALILTTDGAFTNEVTTPNVAIARNGTSRWADTINAFPRVQVIDNETGLEVT
jgi:hypothetical protein